MDGWLESILLLVCILALSVIIVSTVVGYVAVRKPSSPAPRLRKLGKMEEILHRLCMSGNLQVSFAAVVKSSIRLEDSVIKRALGELTWKHPLLRMHITAINGKPHFTPSYQPINVHTHSHSGTWQTFLEKTLLKPLDIKEGLWKVYMLRSNETQGQYVFVFTFHHSVGDGLCKARLITEFAHKLNSVLSKEAKPEKQFDLLPSLDVSVRAILKRSLIDQLLFAMIANIPTSNLLLNTTKKLKNPPQSNTKNKFIEKYGCEMERDCSVQPQTCLIPVRLGKAETSKFLSATRQRQTTVQGVLSAACALVLKDLLDEQDADDRYKTAGICHIPIRTTVNVRRYLNGMVPDDYMGSYFVGLFNHNIQIPSSYSPRSQFWLCASQATAHLKALLKSRQIVTTFWNILEILYHSPQTNKPTENHKASPNRTAEILSLNNYGLCPSKGKRGDRVKLKGCYCAVSEHNRGPIFTVNAVTVEGQLCLSFVYYTNVTKRELAVTFARRVKKELIQNVLS